MKKRVYLALVVVFSLSMLLSACGTKKTNSGASDTDPKATNGETAKTEPGTSTTPTNPEPGKPEKYSLPLVTDGSITISIATVENNLAGYSYTSNLEVWQKLEKDTGVKIDWQVTPNSDYNTVMQTRLAAGTDLPDFVRIPSNPMTYVADGIILPLSDQLARNGYYTTQLYEENPYIKPFITAPDGEIYFFTSDVAGAAEADPYVYMVREDWLEATGLEAPETLDDWYTMWKAFLEEDPNGNGKRDEIPFSNDNKLIGVTVFGNAFGLKLHRSSGWNVNDQGIVEYDYVKPEMKELLTWLNKCYSEGLLDKEFATQGFDVIMKKVSSNQSGGVFRALNGLTTFNNALADAGIDGKYIVVDPPKKSADSTIPQYVERYGPVSGLFGFTKDTKDLDVKFKFIDYVTASKEGAYATALGIEGKSYEIVDGRPVYTEYVTNNPDGKTMNDVLRSLGCSPTVPWNRSLNGYWSDYHMEAIATNKDASEAAARYQKYNIANFPQGTLLTDDEQSIVAQYQTDINTYQDEMIIKFIMGVESLDDFDKYVKNINALGLDKVIAVRQTQYERYQQSQK